jgi:hypothetical protein
MSATQAVLLVVVLVAFVISCAARGRRQTAGPVRARGETRAELDAALGASLTSFQAALALWQIEGPSGRSARSKGGPARSAPVPSVLAAAETQPQAARRQAQCSPSRR